MASEEMIKNKLFHEYMLDKNRRAIEANGVEAALSGVHPPLEKDVPWVSSEGSIVRPTGGLTYKDLPPVSLDLTVDTQWPGWTPDRVYLFFTRMGGFCAFYSQLLLDQQVNGKDLTQLIGEQGFNLLQGLGVENYWHRYKIINAIKVMSTEAEKMRIENRKKKKQLREKNNDKLDYDGDGDKDLEDFFLASQQMASDFWSFVINKDVMKFVVGIVIAGRVSSIVKGATEGILTPVLIGTWFHKEMRNEFTVLSPGRTYNASDSSTHYLLLTQAKKDGAVVVEWGIVVQDLIEALTLGLFLYALFVLTKSLKKRAKELYFAKDKSFDKMVEDNNGVGNKSNR